MKTSKKGIDLIKGFESLELTAYKDSVGVPTIGYGHTGKDVAISDVILKKTITETKANELLAEDLKRFEIGVSSLLKSVSLNQNQFDALVSFSFNLGLGSLEKSTLLKKIKANTEDDSIKLEFAKWNRAGGKILAGLTRRRKSESDLYFEK